MKPGPRRDLHLAIRSARTTAHHLAWVLNSLSLSTTERELVEIELQLVRGSVRRLVQLARRSRRPLTLSPHLGEGRA